VLQRFFQGVKNAFDPNHHTMPPVTPDDRQQVLYSKVKGTDSIVIKNLTLVRPEKDVKTLADSPVLFEDLNLEIPRGMRLALIGKNGTGKSTLLRGLVGYWPFGKGEITMPADLNVLPLPQNPYVPDMPFRAAISFPASEESFTDEEIADALRAVEHQDLIKLMPKKLDTFLDKFVIPYTASLPSRYSHILNRIPDDQVERFSSHLMNKMIEEITFKTSSEWQASRLHGIFMQAFREQRANTVLNDTTHFMDIQLRKLADAIMEEVKDQFEVPKEMHWLLKVPVALKNIFNLAVGRPIKTEFQLAADAQESRRLTALIEYYHDRQAVQEASGAALQMEKSGGEKQRLRFASVLLNKPDILIGDEPTSALDDETGHALMKLITERLPRTTTMIFVVHDRSMLKYFDFVGEIKDKKLTVRPYDPSMDKSPVVAPAQEAPKP